MEAGVEKMEPQDLEAAFSLFNEVSRQLSGAYDELQGKVASLAAQLEIANGNLKRELEEKAALSRRLSSLLAHLPAGVVELDGSGHVVRLNPAAERLLGHLVGQSWADVLKNRFEAMPDGVLWRCRGEEGEYRISLTETHIPEEGLQLLLIHDMTQSWELQQALTRHQRLAAMGEMAAGLAHQLRTPLSAALLYTGHLATPTLGAEERTRFGGKALDRLHYLEALISNMLRFVRGQQQELAAVPVRPMLEEAAQMVAPGFEARQLQLQLLGLDAEQWVRVNRKELIGAIVNLLDNAMHVSRPGDQIELALALQADQVLIQIRDQGPGIAEEALTRLFQPFYTTRKDGTGLGLAIVRNLVTGYGGAVQVETHLGEGSCFTISLPVLKGVSTL